MSRKKSKKTRRPTPVEAVKHKDKRVNIPTEELRNFVSDDESRPKKIFYPRDPSLDPQLVWKGKDEQDSKDLEVDCVPIYIQEKINPKVIVEEVRLEAKTGKPRQADLFADFNGIEFDKMVDFYRHEQNWSNRMILGDSLLVMTSLAEKEGLKGKVQMIYLDPPYGIKFGSNWQVSTRKHEVKDGKFTDMTRQPEQIRAFRDTWELGIHSYLAYWRDRLKVVRELLTETGSVFVQIGDENIHLVRCLLDEIFGSDNFVRLICLGKTGGLESALLNTVFDYILWYAKDVSLIKYRPIFKEKLLGEEGATKYKRVLLSDGSLRPAKKEELVMSEVLDEGGRFCTDDNLSSQGNPVFEFNWQGKSYSYPWKTTEQGLRRLGLSNRLYESRATLRYLRMFDDFRATPVTNNWADIGGIQSRSDPKIYVVQTATRAIELCVLMTTDPGDLVLDPTCGSGTAAYVSEQWGRRWITIDTSRVALALARTRLMAARFPYYILADSPDGIEKEAELTGKTPPPYKTEGDMKKGFVYQRVPHISLKSIATNAEINAIYEKWQEKLEPIRSQLNTILKKKWEDWEVPSEPEDVWPKKAKDLLSECWKLRSKRQAEIDASNAMNGDVEILYDRPFEDKRIIRVTGPFTVESLSPHRVLSPEEELPTSEARARRAGMGQFESMILENLKKAGVQNTIKNERLEFNWLDTYAGEWLHAEGEYTEKDGTKRRVGVCIGPEYDTVSPDLIKEAAKEAVKGVGFDLLIVCGFAFDPHVSEEATRYGKLTVLTTRMNPDMVLGDEFLKRTRVANLFMVFGEPDIEIHKQDGKIVAEIKGVDIYDPTTGEIRSNSIDEIACWFIDTDYNEESFFVRHAYFTGADTPYQNLKKALKAEIDETAWQSIYSTKSRPFDPPTKGKIAVKVINHYGDEVLKVYEV
jgi:adenine-specific DNA-methyltransferase